jgi:hypothetical protein
MRAWKLATTLALGLTLSACSSQSRSQFPTTQGLGLERVVLYRNGVGYFERKGEVDGDLLRIKVRKDQINDLLKSLTIVDRKTGQAVSVSMPLDPQTWASAALTALQPGHGSLFEVLDSLRGVEVTLDTTRGKVAGRIVLVEESADEPDPSMPTARRGAPPQELGRDAKVTLMAGQQLKVVRLSKVRAVTIADGDLAMQFHRRLDASAGEGMFQQVDVAIRLHGDASHDLVVSYVVQAPMWKPTYRIVLPEKGKGEALLQGWAVVDNVSGEDWRDVNLSLTSGAPIAFRYDLHTPRQVHRDDLTHVGSRKQARAAVGEATYTESDDDEGGEIAEEEAKAAAAQAYGSGSMAPGAPPPPPMKKPASRRPRRSRPKDKKKRDYARNERRSAGYGGKGGLGLRGGPAEDAFDMPAPEPEMTLDALRRSTKAQARAQHASGLTRFDIGTRVTVPDGTSTMVALINQTVVGEETFLYKPGGGGSGYEANPYRVVRFKNNTPFVLEPGPISIYAGGSFVGEGLSEAVGTNTSATVPFAVEPTIMVTREGKSMPEQTKLVSINRGTIHIERFNRMQTTWKVQAQTMKDGFTVLVRHPRSGFNYKLETRPPETEDLPNAYLVPVKVPKGTTKASVEVVESTPRRTTIAIYDRKALPLLEQLLVAKGLSAAERAKLEPIVKLRREMGRIDEQISGRERQQDQLDERMRQTRLNIRAIEKDKSPAAARLRVEQQKRLEEFTAESNRVGREIVALQSQHLQKKIKLGDMLENLTIKAPDAKK